MLFVASYENLIYFHEDRAKEFAKCIKELIKKPQLALLRLKSLEMSIENPIPKQTKVVIENEKIETITDPDFNPDIYEEPKQICAKCNQGEIYFENERCCFCHYEEIGPSISTEEHFN